jgi:hypothetical protein
MISEVHSRLRSWGTEIGQYHQSERIATLPNERLKSVVSGGYCAGVALDWIRRALVSGKDSYTDGNLRQDVRVAYAWTQQTSEKKNNFLQQKLTSLNSGVNLKLGRDQEEANREIAEVDRKIDLAFEKLNRATDLTQRQRQEAAQKIQTLYDRLISEIRSRQSHKREQYSNAIDQWQDKPTMVKFWGEYARVMDEYLEKDRRSRGKVGPSERGFGNLKVVSSVDSRDFNGVAALIDTLIRDSNFESNFAAYLSINPPLENATGHAIAILRLNTGGKYQMFEPNFGTYELATDKLREAVVYIFKKAYPNVPSGTSDNHAYEINGKVKGGYTIFEGSRRPVPSVIPLSNPTTFRTEPVILAPLTTPQRFERGGTGQRPIGSTQTSGNQPKTGVSDLINRFNR